MPSACRPSPRPSARNAWAVKPSPRADGNISCARPHLFSRNLWCASSCTTSCTCFSQGSAMSWLTSVSTPATRTGARGDQNERPCISCSSLMICDCIACGAIMPCGTCSRFNWSAACPTSSCLWAITHVGALCSAIILQNKTVLPPPVAITPSTSRAPRPQAAYISAFICV